MEYVVGKSLKEIHQSQSLTLDNIVKIFLAICDALENAHNAGIVHYDIKPTNIILTPDNTPKILDFGLAKIVGVTDKSSQTAISGTLAYMSPEQINGEKTDHRSDLFSLGIVLYEILTDHLPFCGEYEASIMYAIVHQKPVKLNVFRTDMPSQ